jgi:magnesium-protoporphyrin IX monomethyl ester (oxidative) cyclase
MKIALINPPFIFTDREEIALSQCLGLRYLSSYLRSQGNHEIQFIDALVQGISNVQSYGRGYLVGLDVKDIIAKISPDTDIIGLSVPFSQLAPVAHAIVERAKQSLPHTKIVMGGVYPSTQPRLAMTSETDYIVVGEGEDSFAKIVGGAVPEDLMGVYTSQSILNENILSTKFIEDLDSLPFIDYSIPSIDKYFSFSPRGKRGRTASIITSRGCPFNCEFCSIHPMYGKIYRYRSAANVLEEIKYLIECHQIKTLEIEDDNFTLRKERTVEVLEGIIRLNEKGANLGWWTPNGIKIDTLDEDIIKLIRQANCEKIVLAVEHGDPGMLRIMNKKIDLDKAFHTIELFVKHRIPKIDLFFIVGYPGETLKRFGNGYNYMKKISQLGRNISITVNITQPYPGTKLTARCIAEGWIDKNFDNFLMSKDITSTDSIVAITTPDFTAQEVMRRKAVLEEIFDNYPTWKTIVKKAMPRPLFNTMRYLKNAAQQPKFMKSPH